MKRLATHIPFHAEQLRPGILFTFLFLFTCLLVQAQTELRVITIFTHRTYEFNAGKKIAGPDSAQVARLQFAPVSQVLAQATPVVVKDYGPGGIATLTLRGTGPEHTKILWNGVPLNSAAMGLVDLSLVPAEAFSHTDLVAGGSGAINGSSATGGVILLHNRLDYSEANHFSFGFLGGTGRDFRNYAKVETSIAGCKVQTLVYQQSAINNFIFANPTLPGNPPQRRENGQMQGSGIMQSLRIRFPKLGELNFDVWLQGSDRNIPAPVTVAQSEATQKDSSLRAVFTHRLIFRSRWDDKKNGYSVLTTRGGYFHETILYIDPAAAIRSRTRMESLFGETEIMIKINKKLKFNAGATFNRLGAGSENYGGLVNENRAGAFASAETRIWKEKLILTASVRKDFAESVNPPLSPGAGMNFKILSGKKTGIGVRGSFTRVYNLPTLNMRFWAPGGNPDVKPEHGWSCDGALDVSHTSGKWDLQFTGGAFSIHLSDWIQWVPVSGTSLWTPENLRKVWSRGLENSLEIHRRTASSHFYLKANYSYTRCTNTAIAAGHPQGALHKQLIYVPVHNANTTLGCTFFRWDLALTHQFTGNRFVTADNTDLLPAYLMFHFSAARHFVLRKNTPQGPQHFDLSLRVNNIFNTYAESVRFLPLQSRSFLAGLRWNFSFHPKKLKK